MYLFLLALCMFIYLMNYYILRLCYQIYTSYYEVCLFIPVNTFCFKYYIMYYYSVSFILDSICI